MYPIPISVRFLSLFKRDGPFWLAKRILKRRPKENKLDHARRKRHMHDVWWWRDNCRRTNRRAKLYSYLSNMLCPKCESKLSKEIFHSEKHYGCGFSRYSCKHPGCDFSYDYHWDDEDDCDS